MLTKAFRSWKSSREVHSRWGLAAGEGSINMFCFSQVIKWDGIWFWCDQRASILNECTGRDACVCAFLSVRFVFMPFVSTFWYFPSVNSLTPNQVLPNLACCVSGQPSQMLFCLFSAVLADVNRSLVGRGAYLAKQTRNPQRGVK